MDVRQTIAELTSQLSEINYDSEEDNILLKDSYTDDVHHSSIDDDSNEVEPSKLRKTIDLETFPENIYGGKTTTRKKTYSESDLSENDSSSDLSKEESSDHSEEEVMEEESEYSSEKSESGGNRQNHLTKNIFTDKRDGRINYDIYSSKSKNIANDVKKGSSIKNQLKFWESLLECRIKLQKGLAACNNLPTPKDLSEVKMHLDTENQQKLNKCKKNLLLLLGKMVNLQKILLKQWHVVDKSSTMTSSDDNEDIASDECEVEDSEDKDKNQGSEDEEKDQPLRKKRKLNEYSFLIKDNHAKFTPFRNSSIQKWNDKTKVSSGKIANSNFSAFDHSTLKQIEQIMADKSRLINRTRIKRREHHNNSIEKKGDMVQKSQETILDAEIFDDSDFYHKLLRDYIERRSVDVTNSSNTERQLMELQKIRSKMKRNVDTKSSKGRKLRYVIFPKLMNFMAPDGYNTWNERAETELYNSLFGKIKV